MRKKLSENLTSEVKCYKNLLRNASLFLKYPVPRFNN